MKRLAFFTASIAVAIGLNACTTFHAKTLPEPIQPEALIENEDTLNVWVYLTDKGLINSLEAYKNVVSERSLLRRAKVKPGNQLLDTTDIPVKQAYIDSIARYVVKVRFPSRWFNALSVRATPTQIKRISEFPFVRQINPTKRLPAGETSYTDNALQFFAPDPYKNTQILQHRLNYGPSLEQLELLNIPVLHDSGNCGQGVLIGMFDSGVGLLNHEVFDSLTVIATYDFVDDESDIAPGNHGTMTLSAAAGYKPGQLIGPAYCASYVLARTEVATSETPVEEDNWVRAIEWADSIGIDIASTSLGYLDYDPRDTVDGPEDWTWKDMDGNTTLITRAADMAASKGILVFNSAGNGGENPLHNTLGAPADGDSIIAVGAVFGKDITGSTGKILFVKKERAFFSSVGPTTGKDPRIKPDIMAMGIYVYLAHPNDPRLYTESHGTSFACPVAAGAAALLLRDHPEATPMQIRDALRLTADNAKNPDNRYGWGVPDLVAALKYLDDLLGTAKPPR